MVTRCLESYHRSEKHRKRTLRVYTIDKLPLAYLQRPFERDRDPTLAIVLDPGFLQRGGIEQLVTREASNYASPRPEVARLGSLAEAAGSR